MKIAYLTNQYPKVSHAFIRREILALESQGFEVLRYSIRPTPDKLVDAQDVAEESKTRILLAGGLFGLIWATGLVKLRHPFRYTKAAMQTVKIGWRSERGLLIHMIYLMEAARLLRWCKKERADHVHVHFGTNPTTVAMLCKMMGGPTFSMTVHGPEEFDKPIAIHLARKIKEAAFVVGISSFGKSQLFRWCSHEHWGKIKEIHCGVSPKFLEMPLQTIGESKKLVCVGRLCEQKGQLLLMQAARRLKDEGHDFELILAGDGEMRLDVEELIERYRLQDHVTITGWVSSEQVVELIEQSRALVLPSFGEGLPVVIMEALALGRPVVSTYVAGIPELVHDCTNGFLVPAGNVVELTRAMRQCLELPSGRLEDMGRTGRKQVAEKHDASREARKLAGLFQEYGGGGGKKSAAVKGSDG
ncbi:glycosyltransferase [Poriferisphaera sp. WC338]|uniref:glycosyltransferase n=1 Tax=Poriferisphaera sp. WC338 TaxID=3425129 RepID=UPI003D816AB4